MEMIIFGISIICGGILLGWHIDCLLDKIDKLKISVKIPINLKYR
jgi:hypothetical protein